MPPDATQWRVDLAREVAPAYAADINVGAVAIAGSVARGLADRYSDIELHVFWRVPPTTQARVAAAARAGGKIDFVWTEAPTEEEYKTIIEKTHGQVGLLWPREDDEWSEIYYVKGVFIDVSNFLASQVDSYLTDILTRHDPSDVKQMLISAVQCAIPLHGEGVIERWRKRASTYPIELSRAVVLQNLSVEKDWWACDQLVDRGERVLLSELFCTMERKILRLLLGLNRIYIPDVRLKWGRHLIEQMTIRPSRLAERLRDVFRLEPRLAVIEIQQLLEETWNLVEEHSPDIEPARLSRWFRHRRVVWEGPPA